MQLMVLRGVPETRLKKPLKQAKDQKDVPAYKYDSIKDMLSYYLECTTYVSASHITTIEKPVAIGPVYPKIFDNRVGSDGSIVIKRPSGISKTLFLFLMFCLVTSVVFCFRCRQYTSDGWLAFKCRNCSSNTLTSCGGSEDKISQVASI